VADPRCTIALTLDTEASVEVDGARLVISTSGTRVAIGFTEPAHPAQGQMAMAWRLLRAAQALHDHCWRALAHHDTRQTLPHQEPDQGGRHHLKC
jgi:hypothetical protein